MIAIHATRVRFSDSAHQVLFTAGRPGGSFSGALSNYCSYFISRVDGFLISNRTAWMDGFCVSLSAILPNTVSSISTPSVRPDPLP